MRCQTQENQNQASGNRLHVPGFTRNPEVTEPEASDLEGFYWMPRRGWRNASSSSGRNESHNPNAQALGDGLQSKEDDGMTTMLPAIQADFRASGDRLPDQDQQKKLGSHQEFCQFHFSLQTTLSYRKNCSSTKKKFGSGRTHSGGVQQIREH